MYDKGDKVIVIDNNVEAVVVGYANNWCDLLLLNPIHDDYGNYKHTWTAFESDVKRM